MDEPVVDDRWGLLLSQRARLIETFASWGVDHVEYVAVPTDPLIWVWLGTRTDSQRDALRQHPALLSQARAVLAEVPTTVVGGVSVESAETVRRDYAGNWFYVLR